MADPRGGWLKLYMKITASPVWKKATPTQGWLLINLLVMAAHPPTEVLWKGELIELPPGKFLTSLKQIIVNCDEKLTMQEVRTALALFEKFNFLTMESTKSGRLISIENWGKYQSREYEPNKDSNKELTKSQQRANSQPNKELTKQDADLYMYKNIKNERIEEYKNEDNPPTPLQPSPSAPVSKAVGDEFTRMTGGANLAQLAEIGRLVEQYGESRVIDAMRRAQRNGSRRLGYVIALLQNAQQRASPGAKPRRDDTDWSDVTGW